MPCKQPEDCDDILSKLEYRHNASTNIKKTKVQNQVQLQLKMLFTMM